MATLQANQDYVDYYVFLFLEICTYLVTFIVVLTHICPISKCLLTANYDGLRDVSRISWTVAKFLFMSKLEEKPWCFIKAEIC